MVVMKAMKKIRTVLFCKHGGLIVPVTSGQENIIPDTLEDRIQALVAGVEGKPINSRDEMFALSTKCGSGQNTILFSRMFINK